MRAGYGIFDSLPLPYQYIDQYAANYYPNFSAYAVDPALMEASRLKVHFRMLCHTWSRAWQV